MGNDDASAAMVRIATNLAARRQTALEILDIACSHHRACDAEFDDDAIPGTVFGDLTTEAFMPEVGKPDCLVISTGDGFDWWYENVYGKFSERYGLC